MALVGSFDEQPALMWRLCECALIATAPAEHQ